MPNTDKLPTDPLPSRLVMEDPSYADIVEPFIVGLKDRVEVMERALRANDFETLRGAAHQLKGCGGGYGYPELTERATELERHAGDAMLDECLDALAELKALCARVVTRVDQ